MRALASNPDFEIVWVVEERIAAYRLAMGWTVPDIENVEIIVAPSDEVIQELVVGRLRDTLHLLTGIHMWPYSKKAFKVCVKNGAKIALLNEPPIPGSFLRNMAIRPYHFLHTLIYKKYVSLVLGIGHISVDFYKSVGYSPAKVFPFGYFLDLPEEPVFTASTDPTVKLIYVGQLVPRKGVDILVKALGRLKENNWRLQIIGDGVDAPLLKKMAVDLQIADRVEFTKPLPNAAALQAIAGSDVFILPSRHDGWGAVVNEALLCGVPVICSDRCGAADFVRDDWRGGIFRRESVDDLAILLKKWIDKGPRSVEDFTAIRSWSENIRPAAAAKFLESVIEFNLGKCEKVGPKPQAPWLSKNS
jgi:glycosyltransferase involved in cell wall biosynthesis